MAKWFHDPDRSGKSAIRDLSEAVQTAGLNREEAKALENEIDWWADTIGTHNAKLIDHPTDRDKGYFEIHAENHEVLEVKFCSL